MSKITFYFTDCFSDFASFKTAITDYTNQVIEDDFLNKIYLKICIKYAVSNIRFTIKEMFIYQFCSIFDDEFSKFKRRYDINQNLKNITIDNIKILSETISNTADNPNYTPDTPDKALDYITQQNAVFQKINDLDAYARQLESLMTEGFEEFLNKFKELFVALVDNSPIFYEDNEDNEDNE